MTVVYIFSHVIQINKSFIIIIVVILILIIILILISKYVSFTCSASISNVKFSFFSLNSSVKPYTTFYKTGILSITGFN